MTRFLEWDYSEDDEGLGSFEAMASVGTKHWAAVQAEVAGVLAWAHAEFPDACAPMDEGGEWDCALQGSQEHTTPLTVHFSPEAQALDVQAQAAAPSRYTLVLTLSGTLTFCQALREAFGLDV